MSLHDMVLLLNASQAICICICNLRGMPAECLTPLGELLHEAVDFNWRGGSTSLKIFQLRKSESCILYLKKLAAKSIQTLPSSCLYHGFLLVRVVATFKDTDILSLGFILGL